MGDGGSARVDQRVGMGDWRRYAGFPGVQTRTIARPEVTVGRVRKKCRKGEGGWTRDDGEEIWPRSHNGQWTTPSALTMHDAHDPEGHKESSRQ